MERCTSKAVKRYSTQQKQYFLGEFKESGVSVKDFCQLHNISEGAFRKWQMRQRRMKASLHGGPVEQSNKAPGFAELQITHPSATPRQSVLFAEVTSIRIYQQVAASYLKELQQ